MLPTGHIAAGYLIAQGVLHTFKPDITQSQNVALLWWGAFFGFCPDLDMFYAFWRAKGFILPRKEVNHRYYVTHRPLIWLAAGLLVFFSSFSPFWKTFGLLLWLGPWSHFVLDSFKVGIMWLWPFSNRYFALYKPGEREESPERTFYRYWMWFLHFYMIDHPMTFYIEVLVLVTATVVLGISMRGGV